MSTHVGADARGSASLRQSFGRIVSVLAVGGAVWLAAACATLASDPTVPASIEALPLAFPSIAVGDSLRDTLGVAQPIQVLLRDLSGAVITDLPVRYLYVQHARDSALEVDSITGYVRARKRPTGTPTQIAVRFGSAIQIVIPIKVSKEPDTLSLTNIPEVLLFFPDTGTKGVNDNSSSIDVKLQYDSAGTLFNAADWLVRYTVVRPLNLTNDTTASVFMVGADHTRPTQLDTTSTTGEASLRVRVRQAAFQDVPAAGDSVEVEVMVVKRGSPIKGAPLRVWIPVKPRGVDASSSVARDSANGASNR